MMSQVLQCTQFSKLICSFFEGAPAAGFSTSTISYTAAGQNRVQGFPYSLAHFVAQRFVSATRRCGGWLRREPRSCQRAAVSALRVLVVGQPDVKSASADDKPHYQGDYPFHVPCGFFPCWETIRFLLP